MSVNILTTSIIHPNEFSIITGKTSLINDLASVDQAIKLLLTTAKGELFGDPNFGCNLYSYLFQYSGEVLNQLIKDDIVETLTNQDSRIEINPDNITIDEEGTTLHINIKYSLRHTDFSSETTLLITKRNEEEY